jgi:diadenosine tetraphosphate (Ap4A) HIT family hydrolase
MTTDCPFCTLNPRTLVLANELAVAFYDRYPVSHGHLLIILRRHVASYFEATPTEQTALMELVNQGKKKLDQEFHPDGYNIGINIGTAAGQTVPHLHIHLIPRYQGDQVDPRGGVRGVIPEKQKY